MLRENIRVIQGTSVFQSYTEHEINRFKLKETFTDRQPKSATSEHKREQAGTCSTDSLTMKQSFKTTIQITTNKQTPKQILPAGKHLNKTKNKQWQKGHPARQYCSSVRRPKLQLFFFFFSEYLSKNKVLIAAAYPSTVFEPLPQLPPQCCAYRIWSKPLSLN